MTKECAFTVNVYGSTDFFGDSLERNFLAMEAAANISKMMHSGNYSWKRKTGAESRINGGDSAFSPGPETRTVFFKRPSRPVRSTLQTRRASSASGE
jgi:hypothetical protein